MSLLTTLLDNDRKIIMREFILVYIMLAPLFMIAIFKWQLPNIVAWAAPYVNLNQYMHLISLMVVLFAPMLFGLVVGLMMLDERDENVLEAIAVTSISKEFYLSYRLIVVYIVSFFYTFLAMAYFNVHVVSISQQIPLFLLNALIAPFTVLLLVTFSGNKIEGLVYAKAGNFLTWAPIVAYFLSPPYRYIFAIFPTYWTAFAYFAAIDGDSSFMLLILAGFVVNIVELYFLGKKFQSSRI